MLLRISTPSKDCACDLVMDRDASWVWAAATPTELVSAEATALGSIEPGVATQRYAFRLASSNLATQCTVEY